MHAQLCTASTCSSQCQVAVVGNASTDCITVIRMLHRFCMPMLGTNNTLLLR